MYGGYGSCRVGILKGVGAGCDIRRGGGGFEISGCFTAENKMTNNFSVPSIQNLTK